MAYKVLIVDDEQIVKLAVKSMIDWKTGRFELAGTASDGVSALQIVEKENVDIVITDLKMPRMDGIELISKLRDREHPPEVLVLSNYSDFEHVRHALKLGAYDYMLKTTIDPDNLMKIMADLSHILDLKRPPGSPNIEPAGTAAGENDEHSPENPNSLPESSTGSSSGDSSGVAHRTVNGGNEGDVAQNADSEGFLVELEGDVELFRETLVSELAAEKQSSLAIMWIVPGIANQPDTDQVFHMVAALAEQGLRSSKRCIVQKQNSGAIVLGVLSSGKSIQGESAARWLSDQARLYYVVELGIVHSPPITRVESLRTTLSDCARVAELFFYENCSTTILSSITNAEAGAETVLRASMPPLSTLPERGQVTQNMIRDSLIRLIHWCSVKRASPRFLKRQLGKWVDEWRPRCDFELPSPERIQAAANEPALFALFGFEAVRGNTGSSEAIGRYRVEVQKVLDYIEQHAVDRISVAFLAQMVRMSETYLCTVFKSQTGKSIVSYINDSKLDRAKDLLVTGRYLIKEVAAEVGIEDPFYFNRLFKRRFGITPSEMLP